MSLLRPVILLGALLVPGVALAQPPASSAPSPAPAARRFPQPVRVGDLVGRAVLLPLESQPVVGRVDGLVRRADGTLHVVVRYGGALSFGRRPVSVPADAMVLLGADMEVMDLTPAQLDALPTFDGAGTTPVPPGETVAIGLARPSH